MRAIAIRRNGIPVAEGVLFADGQVVMRSALERLRQNLKVYGQYSDLLLDYRGCEIQQVPVELSTGMGFG
jgi:hypothetical protein